VTVPDLAELLGRLDREDMDLLALLGATNAFAAAGRIDDADKLFRAWIAKYPDHPALFAAHFNFGTALNGAGRLAEAAECFRRCIAGNPDFIQPYIILGNILEHFGDRLGAVEQWRTAVNRLAQVTPEALDHKLMALKQLGRVLGNADIDELAENALEQSLMLDIHQRDVVQNWFNLRQRRCRWPLLDSLPEQRRAIALAEISPLSVASFSDDPLWQLAQAAVFTCEEIGDPGDPFPERAPPLATEANRRLRIGYLSSDLWDHAVGFLTAEVYGLHDRQRFEVFAYYNGAPHDGRTQARIRQGVDHWREIRDLGDRAAAQRMVEDGIDILVDLNGHTKDARTALLALNPAPVIVNWLGYPGTMGSNFHHYLVGDPFIIPEECERFYSEKVVRLPCYQPTDRDRLVAETAPTRESAGLPADGFVFCSFNETRKISEATWRRWMAILRAVPESVLWLLVPSVNSRALLEELAQRYGIAPARLVFAGRLGNPEHLARYALADLILDNFPYGAHTTASDALWMGVPVLTLAGRSFASRVCGSLVRAAGLPDLVCADEADYIAKAVALGTDRPRCAALKARLQQGRHQALLFDTPRLVRSLEALFHQMWEDFCKGERPRPDLSNMELYQEIGIELASRSPPADYDAAYRAALDRRRHARYWRPDGRLPAG
jgi:predicted O-linked N-acetylglucosamine transferase (SPINDLY family)